MSSFLAFVKALPVIANFLKMLMGMYDTWQDKSIEKHYNKKKLVKSRIAKELEKALTDEQRKDLVRRLSDLTNT